MVVAGGREPAHWEQYPGHQFLSTVGALPCCAHGGCWRSRCQVVGDGDNKDRHSVCDYPVEVASDLAIPRCMDMITPQDVIRRIEMYYQPGGRGVRVDTHAYAGYTIPPLYDSMIGKLITTGRDRRDALDKMQRALQEYMITGIKTTIGFQQAILQDPNFRRGVYSTSFIENLLSGARRDLIQDKA